MELKTFFAQDKDGTVVPGAYVYLYHAGTVNLVSGIQDPEGDPLPNPFQSSEDGLVQLAAPDGEYDLRVASSGRDNRIRVRFLDASSALESISLSEERAEAEANRAEVEADRASQARDVAVSSTSIFPDTASGLSATADQGYFSVPSPENSEYLILYQSNAGSALEIKRYPSRFMVNDIYLSRMETLSNGGLYKERYELADISSFLIENLQDAASVNVDLSRVPNGLQVSLNTARTIAIKTQNKIGSAKANIKMHAEVTYGGSSCTTGIGMTDGIDRWNIKVMSNGWLTLQNTRGGGGILSQNLYQFQSGDSVDIELIASPASEEVQARVSVAGRAPFIIGLSNIPMGDIELIQDEVGSSIVYSLEITALNAFQRNYDGTDPALSDAQTGDIFALSTFMAGYERVFPSGFSGRFDDYLKIYRHPVTSDFLVNYKPNDIIDPMDPEAAELYVDIGIGNDENPGTKELPLKSINRALKGILTNAKARILVRGGLYPYAQCWKSVSPADGATLVVSSWDGNPVISSAHDETLSWTLDTDDTYYASYSVPVLNVADASNPTLDGDHSLLTKVTDLATCKATPGSSYDDGANLYVHTFDGRAPDSDIRVYVGGQYDTANGKWDSKNGSLQLVNIHFEGGKYAFRGSLSSPSSSANVYGKNCSFKYANQGSSPVVNGQFTAIWEECVAAWNQGDGFHYNPIFDSVPADGMEINCIGRWNGVSAGGVGNNSSNHGGSTIRIKTKQGWGDYHHAEHRGIHDIMQTEASLSWSLGITSRDSRNGYANFAFGLGSGANRAWLDGCTSSGASADIESNGADTIVYLSDFNGDSVNIGSGQIEAYQP